MGAQRVGGYIGGTQVLDSLEKGKKSTANLQQQVGGVFLCLVCLSVVPLSKQYEPPGAPPPGCT